MSTIDQTIGAAVASGAAPSRQRLRRTVEPGAPGGPARAAPDLLPGQDRRQHRAGHRGLDDLRAGGGLVVALVTAAYLTAVFVVLSPLRALAFVVVQQGLFGLYLGCAFAPNH